MKPRPSSRRRFGLWTVVTAAAWTIAIAGARAASAGSDEPAAQIPLTLTAGESYTIEGLAPGSTPAVRVIENAHALVIHGETPGKLILLGAERGRWIVTVIRSDGHPAAYDVAVNSVATPGAPLKPGTSPDATIGDGLPGARAAQSPSSAPSMRLAAAPPGPTSPGTIVPIAGDSAAPAPVAPAPQFGFEPAPPPAARSATSSGDETPVGKWRSNPSVARAGGNISPSMSGGPHSPNFISGDAVELMQGTSRVLDFARRLTRISIADSKIADIQVVNPFQINLVAHTPGFTTLAVWDDRGNYLERQVRVDTGGRQQVMLNCIVAELDRSNIENQGVNLSVALQNYGLSLFGMPGAVATPFSAQLPISTVLPNGTVISGQEATLPPSGSLIPLMLSQNLTYGLAAGNSQIQTQSFFQFLENHNLARILAEPHLLANSGEQAKFLSGGEIPIVIAQALNTSIVFKEFGTSVEFLPTVIGRDTIELYVKPEVSQPDYAHGVSMFGFTVPAFVTRRAQTMVRLRDGQTLILAGLILHNPISTVNKVPYLGDVPYLGGLFRTTSHTTQETDLVMSVTPQIVTPLPDGAQVDLPHGSRLSPEDVKTRPISPPDASRPRF
ncbi:MAG TPA: pilus assembly protein N-terminal domain-containing protein [Candidatus Binataceae bacterium]|nr:pilus assembly protein N-terminal domain-containing protein [Candidatus Binataceae bacterium]